MEQHLLLNKLCLSGAIPVVNQVMSATSGATGILSGVARHVNDSVNQNYALLLLNRNFFQLQFSSLLTLSLSLSLLLLAEEIGGKKH